MAVALARTPVARVLGVIWMVPVDGVAAGFELWCFIHVLVRLLSNRLGVGDAEVLFLGNRL